MEKTAFEEVEERQSEKIFKIEKEPLKFKNQLDLVLKLIICLKKPSSMKDLKIALSVTERTVYRYMDFLEGLGFTLKKTDTICPRRFQIIGGSKYLFNTALELMVYSDPKKQ